MNEELIEQLALEVANETIVHIAADDPASKYQITQFATRFFARVDAERAKDGPVASLWRDMNSGGKAGVLKVCQVTPCDDSFPVYLHPQQDKGEVVVTTDAAGRCVAVTRQDKEGRVLSVIWEAQPIPEGYKLVPEVSTSTMDFAGVDAVRLEGFGRDEAEICYKAMLAESQEVKP